MFFFSLLLYQMQKVLTTIQTTNGMLTAAGCVAAGYMSLASTTASYVASLPPTSIMPTFLQNRGIAATLLAGGIGWYLGSTEMGIIAGTSVLLGINLARMNRGEGIGL